MTFGEKLRIMMLKQNFTKELLCKKSGIARQTLQGWIDGTRNPTESSILRLANAFECTMYDIMQDVNEIEMD